MRHRHTYASWAIAAGLPTFEIAATMGTSLEQLSKTYAHLLPDSADRARVALDTYINNAAEAAERGVGMKAAGRRARQGAGAPATSDSSTFSSS
jgi:hypothetical protein